MMWHQGQGCLPVYVDLPDARIWHIRIRSLHLGRLFNAFSSTDMMTGELGASTFHALKIKRSIGDVITTADKLTVRLELLTSPNSRGAGFTTGLSLGCHSNHGDWLK